MSDKDKRLKIYEAGKMSGLSFDEMNSYRKELKSKLNKAADDSGYCISVVNPVDFYNFEEHKHQSESEIMKFDLHHVKTSDVLVVNMKHLDSSIGTIIELYEALRSNIPVIAFGSFKEYYPLHPWIKECITRHENTMDDVVNYVKEFYMI